MKKEQPKEYFNLQVNSDLKALGYVLEWFSTISQSTLSADCFLQCKIMLAEGFTNAVRHAHKNYPPQTIINLELYFYQNYLEIKIWDCGQPFNLKEKLDSLLNEKQTNSILELAEGGRGLQFINGLADHFFYIRDSQKQRNCLIMQKTLK